MDRDELTARQCYFLLFLFLLGNLVTAAGVKGTQAGWLLFLLLGVVLLPVYALFHKASEGRPAGEIFVNALGNVPGMILTALYCILAVLMAGDAMRLFADFIVINDLNDAGAWGNTALLTLAILLMLLCSLRSLGKAAWAVQPLAVFLLLLSVVVTVKKADFHRLLPLFSESPKLLLRSAVSSFAAMIAASYFPVAALGTGGSKTKRLATYVAGTSACVLLALLSLRDASVLGSPAVELFRFPMFAAAATTRHSQILISSVFVLVQPFRAALCLRYTQACLEYWLPRLKYWYPPVLLSFAVLSGSLSWSSEQVRWRTAGEIAVSVLLLAGPLAVVIVQRIKAKRSQV